MLLPSPASRPRLIIGSTGRRALGASLPHVDAWNTWFDWYGNTPEGFAGRVAEIDEALRRTGRDPSEVERSACLLVAPLDGASGERPIVPTAPPVTGPPGRIAGELRAMAHAGAHEVILGVDPITEAAIGALGETLASLDA